MDRKLTIIPLCDYVNDPVQMENTDIIFNLLYPYNCYILKVKTFDLDTLRVVLLNGYQRSNKYLPRNS